MIAVSDNDINIDSEDGYNDPLERKKMKNQSWKTVKK